MQFRDHGARSSEGDGRRVECDVEPFARLDHDPRVVFGEHIGADIASGKGGLPWNEPSSFDGIDGARPS